MIEYINSVEDLNQPDPKKTMIILLPAAKKEN